MIERSEAMRGGAMTLSTATLGLALLLLAGCGEFDLTPKLRDYYMGQQFFEPDLFPEATRHDADGEPLLDAEAATETTETTDTVEAP